MMLVEEGKVAPDDRVTKHLPQLPPRWAKIAVRHLLTHSSGIQEYLSVPGLPEQAHAASRDERTRLLAQKLKLDSRRVRHGPTATAASSWSDSRSRSIPPISRVELDGLKPSSLACASGSLAICVARCRSAQLGGTMMLLTWPVEFSSACRAALIWAASRSTKRSADSGKLSFPLCA